MARKNGRLESEPSAAKKTITKFKGVLRKYETSQGTKRGTEGQENCGGSAGSPVWNGSPGLRHLTSKMGQKKHNVSRLFRMMM